MFPTHCTTSVAKGGVQCGAAIAAMLLHDATLQWGVGIEAGQGSKNEKKKRNLQATVKPATIALPCWDGGRGNRACTGNWIRVGIFQLFRAVRDAF